jgi:hypothetical protein
MAVAATHSDAETEAVSRSGREPLRILTGRHERIRGIIARFYRSTGCSGIGRPCPGPGKWGKRPRVARGLKNNADQRRRAIAG